ncbi:MAG: DUF4369 domain-containing protein [Bacteroidaceae bacterium]
MIQKNASKWGLWIVVLLFTLSSCHHRGSRRVQIKGMITGLGNDTVYLVRNKLDSLLIDTLFVSSASFRKEINVDSFDQGYLLIPNLVSFPLYISGQSKINIKGNIDSIWNLTVTGSLKNKELKFFMDSIASFDLVAKRRAVNDYVQSSPDDPISMFLLKHYFLEDQTPPFKKISEVIGDMGGKLRDDLFISNLSDIAKKAQNLEVGDYAPSFSAIDTAKVRQSRYTFNHKVVLLHFWASWKPDTIYLNHLRKLYEKYPPMTSKEVDKINFKLPSYARNIKALPPDLAIVGLSLDVDTLEWQQAVTRDSVPWTQLCDFYGWSSGAASRYAINNVPSLFVIGADSKIDCINPNLNELDSIIDVAMGQAAEIRENELASLKQRELVRKERDSKSHKY